MRKVRRVLVLAAGVAVRCQALSSVRGKERFPRRTVRMIVSTPAASSPDIRARILADELSKDWGEPVVVENRPGGGGIIGAQVVASAPADGYTLLAGSGSTFPIFPAELG